VNRLLVALPFALSSCIAISRDGTQPQALVLEPVTTSTAGPWVPYRVSGVEREVRVFIRRDSSAKPVVVLLQGSGCLPLFTVDGQGRYHGTTPFEDVVTNHLDRFHFAMVEKQGVAELRFPAGMPRNEQFAAFRRVQDGDCSEEYRAAETKDVRVGDAAALIQALSHEPWVQDVLLAGHSEGTRVAAGLIRSSVGALVRAAALLSSSGLQGSTMNPADRREFAAAFHRIERLQRAADDERFDGLPARRWKSYTLEATPMDDLRESKTPLFVAHGGREPDLLGADLFVLEMLRLQPDRPLRYVVVSDGDHGFETSRGEGRMGRVVDEFLTWSTEPKPTTGFDVIQ
jgi:pimeloyl-ACP methyl ester carboxylesterase